MKFQKNGHTVEVTDPNTFSIFIREGFTEVEEDEKSELVKQAKELGIKSPHLMSVETLKEKIDEKLSD